MEKRNQFRENIELIRMDIKEALKGGDTMFTFEHLYTMFNPMIDIEKTCDEIKGVHEWNFHIDETKNRITVRWPS